MNEGGDYPSVGLFGSKSDKKIREGNSGAPDEAVLLKYISNLNPEDLDRLVSISKDRYNNTNVDGRSKSMADYFDLLNRVFNSTNFNSTGNTPHTRNQRYEIYDEMDESTAYISSALDILSDDATQADEDGVIIHIKSGSAKIESLVSEFFEEFEIPEKISKWARLIAKYGDLFVKVEGEYGEGVNYINDTIYPSNVERRDLNGKLMAFTTSTDGGTNPDSVYAPWEFIHFRHKGDIYKAESKYARLGMTGATFEKNLISAYGQSILRPAIKVYAQLRFVENMILLSRLTNSVRRNVFLINVGDVTPDKAFETIANYANLLKKDINMNIEDGIYSSSKHTVNYDEDIFIPVGDPQNDVRIEHIGGDVNIQEQYDLEYLLNKLFSALKVPKAYLNYEQDLNARSTLIQLDIRYARSVSQLQNTIISGLRRLVNIHLAYLGLVPDDIDLEISLTPVSAIDDEARITQKQSQINAARDMWDLVGSIKDSITAQDADATMDVQSVAEYIMSDYLEFDKKLIDKVFGRAPAEEENKGRINSHKSYAGSDIHAMYPTETSLVEYEPIRESIINSLIVTVDEENPESNNE